MNTGFKDHFSGHSSAYGRYRPDYPAELFQYLAGLAPTRERAWDCATGTGQAARGLARPFREVIATDASASQVSQALPHERVTYRVAAAEDSGLADDSVDLLTVAQALHWFDLDRFYREVRRVLRPGGVLAVWCYDRIRAAPDIDPHIERLYSEILGAYWPDERRLVERGYADLAFPFREVTPPGFDMTVHCSFEHLLGYLRTWSAAQRYLEAQGRDPVELVAGAIAETWGGPDAVRRVTWPLRLRVGWSEA